MDISEHNYCRTCGVSLKTQVLCDSCLDKSKKEHNVHRRVIKVYSAKGVRRVFK